MAFKSVFLCTVSVVSVALATPAFAQTAEDSMAPANAVPVGQDDQGQSDDIVVTGVRGSIIGALNVKRESTQVVDSIVAEDVGKLPDNNVIEALQRVTGIQVTNRTGGEASAISIRGLPDALTTMNGRQIFTTTGQSFALQDIPSNLVKQVDVYKTRAADQIETGLAGQVDVKTRRPFDFDGFMISGVARGIYNEQADSFNPNISALISDRWTTGIGDIGILVNGSYSRTKWRDMSVTAGALVPFVTEAGGPGYAPLQRVFPDSGAWQPGLDAGLPSAAGSTFLLNGQQVPYYLSRDAVFSSDASGTRERPAVNAAVQWAPNSSSTYTFEFFWNQFKQTSYNSLMFSFVDWWGNLGPNPGSSIELYPGTNIIKSRTVGAPFNFESGDGTRSTTNSYVYALNGAWNVGDRGKIVADVSYQDSQFDTQFLAMRFNRTAGSITADFNAGGGIPSYHFDDDAALTNPASWTVGEFYDNANRDKGSAFTAQVDAQNEWDDGFLRKVKTGIRYDDRKASSSLRTQSANALGTPLTALDSGLQLTNSDFFDGRASVPTSWMSANSNYLFANTDTIRQLYNSTINAGLDLSDQLNMIKTFDIDEITMSAYVQADAQVDILGRPLRIEAGGRYVDVDTNLVFTDQFSLQTTRGSTPTSAFLPSATLRYDITDKLRLRFNFGKTLRRPNFGDLNPNYSLTGDLTKVGYGSGGSGNAQLRPTRSTNYDVGLEWYFDRDSAIYATLFRREVDGLVVPITSLVTVAGTGLNTNQFLVTRPENASKGVLKGAEVGFTYFPKYLPAFLDGLGAVGSFTLLDSKQNIPLVDIDGNVTGQTESGFFGVSDFSYNVTLAYDKNAIGARLSYVWRKEFLANNEARLFANPIGVWRRPEKSLDFQLTYNVSKQFGVTLDAVNITNEKQQTYYQFGGAGGPTTDNLGTTLLSRTFAIGLRYALK